MPLRSGPEPPETAGVSVRAHNRHSAADEHARERSGQSLLHGGCVLLGTLQAGRKHGNTWPPPTAVNATCTRSSGVIASLSMPTRLVSMR